MSNTGQKLWQKATQIIPGGNMLLSKRPDLWLPDVWPTYYSKAKGCAVWDLDNNRYTDTSIMGIGTSVLGYSNDEVDEAVRGAVDQGNMSTFNCPEEVALAERLVDMHDWSGMVRFARSGGEANAIAIRIARAAAGRNKVAICGYHGWHDWYLAANLADDRNLDGHILPGLDPLGVPHDLSGSVIPFNYNDIKKLVEICDDDDVGVIKMEVVRNAGPEPGFLQAVRDLCDKKGIILIFDECTSGFRETLGGIHKKFGVNPDMATFGKALGNGYAISAILGKRDVMEYGQKTFISSTFWTERIGPTAALKAIEIFERDKSQGVITETGQRVKSVWQELFSGVGLPVEIGGISAIPSFNFDGPDNMLLKTALTQLMLDKGFLATPLMYVSVSHTSDIIDSYREVLGECLQLLGEANRKGNVESLLKGRVCNSGFKRLN